MSVSRGVEALVEEEHSLWRRDASFGAWVEEQRDVMSKMNNVNEVPNGKENYDNPDGFNIEPQQNPLAVSKKNENRRAATVAELDEVERRLMVLQQKTNEKVWAVSCGSDGDVDSGSAWI